MGCARKRGKSWNAQVMIAGWKSSLNRSSQNQMRNSGLIVLTHILLKESQLDEGTGGLRL